MGVLGSGASIMVGRGETVCACGVFQTATVLDFAAAVGPSGRLVVIEANPDNTERLLRDPLPDQVTIVNRAVWSEDTELEFIFASQDTHQHYNRISDPEVEHFPTHMVANPNTTKVLGERIGTTLDRLGIDKLDHLHLTVNGAELAAFAGEQGADLARRVSRIYAHTEFPHPGAQFVSRLRELGFRTRVSERLNARNPDIDLRRLYASRQK